MNFMEALSTMKTQPVIRTSWKQEDGSVSKYVMLLKGMKSPWAILLPKGGQNANAGNNLFEEEDYLATDWEVYA